MLNGNVAELYQWADEAALHGARSKDRGNAGHLELGQLRLSASMGPRSKDRGNRIRGRNEREVASLQWGRDPRIAETFPGSRGSAPLPRFNGAAIQGSRKRRIRRVLHHALSWRLQW